MASTFLLAFIVDVDVSMVFNLLSKYYEPKLNENQWDLNKSCQNVCSSERCLSLSRKRSHHPTAAVAVQSKSGNWLKPTSFIFFPCCILLMAVGWSVFKSKHYVMVIVIRSIFRNISGSYTSIVLEGLVCKTNRCASWRVEWACMPVSMSLTFTKVNCRQMWQSCRQM